MSYYKQFFTIDSHKRNSGVHHDFTYTVTMPNLQNVDLKQLNVVCTSASIPKSYYLIVAPRNTFTLTQNGVAVTITVPPGNDNTNTFRTVLLGLLNAAAAGGAVYSMALDAVTGKYTFTVVGGVGSSVITVPNAMGAGIHDQFGVEKNTTNTMPFTSTNVVSFSTTAALQIHSDIMYELHRHVPGGVRRRVARVQLDRVLRRRYRRALAQAEQQGQLDVLLPPD